MFGLARTDHIQEVIEQWTAETPTLDRSAFAVIGRISRLDDLLEPELDLVFAEYGLTGGEFDVLAALRRSGPPYRLTPTSLRKALLLSSGGMTKRLAGLENRGLAPSRAETGDRRLRAVTSHPERTAPRRCRAARPRCQRGTAAAGPEHKRAERPSTPAGKARRRPPRHRDKATAATTRAAQSASPPARA